MVASDEHLPTIDPTKLTTDAVNKLESILKELFGVQLTALTHRIDDLDRMVHDRPGTILAEVNHLDSLMSERFKAVDKQFVARDAFQSEQNANLVATISKSEAATTKQLDAISRSIDASSKSMDDKVDDLKSRVQSIEGHSKGTSDSWGWIVGAIGAAAGVASVIALVVSLSAGKQPVYITGGDTAKGQGTTTTVSPSP